MRNRIRIIDVCLIGLLCFATSCTQHGKQVEGALLLAGNNRGELEMVLDYYNGNSMKLKAARFLIANMPGAYGVDSLLLNDCQPFYELYDSLSREYGYKTSKEWGLKVDSLWKCFGDIHRVRQKINNDVGVMTARQLIDEIELAFRAWKANAYSQGCSFDDFCEYILPYRRLNGMIIDDARKGFYARHSQSYFTQKGKYWTQEVDSLLYEYRHLEHSAFWGTRIPIWNARTFEKLHRGLCMQRCWYNSLLLSSLGMAVAIDFVPAWGNRNNSHSWNVVMINGESHAFEAFWDKDRWKYKRIYNNRTKDELWGKFRLPKVYRYTYSNHIEGPAADEEMDRRDIPSLFCNIKKKDVSAEYFETTDLTVELTQEKPEGAMYAYLAVWGYQEWHPVQWGKIEDGKAVFRGMGKGVVYLPVYFNRGVVIPAAEPFQLDEDGKVKKLFPQKEVEQVAVRLFTGASAYDKNIEYVGGMKGLRIMGIREGKPGQELCTWVDSMALERTYKPVFVNEPYRYVRMQLPSDSIALGELAFYTKQGRVKKTKIMTDLKSVRKTENQEMLIDGLDATVYCGKVPKGVVDIDLGKEYLLTGIGLAPYLKTELYLLGEFELFYWKGYWVKLNKLQVTDSGYLVFDNVPQGALLMLKDCLWKGKSGERTFIYKDGVAYWQ